MENLFSIREAAREAEQGKPTRSPLTSSAAFSGPVAEENPQGNKNPGKGPLSPFQDANGVDYRRFYRAACNFHEKYTPPDLNDPLYWDKVASEMNDIGTGCGNHVFIVGLLVTVYEELSANYKRATEQKQGEQIKGGNA